jgi:hypothetical protein
MNHLLEIVIALDQFLNTLLGGWADETFSSRCFRCYPTMQVIVDFMFFPIENNHCQKSYESERLRLQEPPELR